MPKWILFQEFKLSPGVLFLGFLSLLETSKEVISKHFPEITHTLKAREGSLKTVFWEDLHCEILTTSEPVKYAKPWIFLKISLWFHLLGNYKKVLIGLIGVIQNISKFS